MTMAVKLILNQGKGVGVNKSQCQAWPSILNTLNLQSTLVSGCGIALESKGQLSW